MIMNLLSDRLACGGGSGLAVTGGLPGCPAVCVVEHNMTHRVHGEVDTYSQSHHSQHHLLH